MLYLTSDSFTDAQLGTATAHATGFDVGKANSSVSVFQHEEVEINENGARLTSLTGTDPERIVVDETEDLVKLKHQTSLTGKFSFNN